MLKINFNNLNKHNQHTINRIIFIIFENQKLVNDFLR